MATHHTERNGLEAFHRMTSALVSDGLFLVHSHMLTHSPLSVGQGKRTACRLRLRQGNRLPIIITGKTD